MHLGTRFAFTLGELLVEVQAFGTSLFWKLVESEKGVARNFPFAFQEFVFINPTMGFGVVTA